jgi:mono/diheme cytochrome c family protein
MRKLVVTVIAVAAVSAASLAAQAPSAEKIKAGMKVYADQKCATCHNVAGVGSKMSPLDGVGSKLTLADIKMWMTDPDAMAAMLAVKPKIKMKKYTLSETDLDALVSYLVSLKKK